MLAKIGRACMLSLAGLALAAAPAAAKNAHRPDAQPRTAKPAPAPMKPCAGARTPASRLTPAAAQHATLCLINRFRKAHGLKSLHTAPTLATAASSFAASMVTNHFFSHMGPDGRDPTTRLTDSGFVSGPNCAVGEDLAWGVGNDSRPADVVHIWKTSATHRENLLDPTFDSIGIGVDEGVPMATAAAAAAAEGGATYVADFGSRGGA